MADVSSHTWLLRGSTLVFMVKTATLSAVLAANIKLMMERYPEEFGSQEKIAAKTRPRIGQRTVQRAQRDIGCATLKTLQAIAHAFRVEPWQLLQPELGGAARSSHVIQELRRIVELVPRPHNQRKGEPGYVERRDHRTSQ